MTTLSALAPAGVLIGIDFGMARIGVAACDAGRILAFPIGVVDAGGDWLHALEELIGQRQPVALIVGYPLTLGGQAGLAAGRIKEMAAALARVCDRPIWLVDERLSTVEAQRRLHEAGRKAKNSRPIIDSQAAVGILEVVLQGLSRGQFHGQRLELEAVND
ncbi:MAG: Holliday junction resolvase RuvX [Propionibacteriaceae bacterium]|nr:Holliday junction resolvase RuvX [Propionibacteriaceae bacterium]